MSAKQRTVLLGIAAGICLFGLVADRLVLTPLARGWRERARRIRELELIVRKGQALLAKEALWEQRLSELEAQELPEDGSAAESLLLSALDDWARESGFHLTSLRPRWTEERGQGRRLELRASGTGRMTAIVDFFFELESSRLALLVEDLELSPRKGTDGMLLVSFRVTGLVGSSPASEEKDGVDA